MSEFDAVQRPKHYVEGRHPEHEPIRVIEGWELDFCLGNCVKYISRAGRKNPDKEIQDLEKARWYLDRRIQQLKHASSVDEQLQRIRREAGL